MKILMLPCFISVLLLASPANADFSLKQYKDAKAAGGDVWEGMRLYLLGASNAYGWANALLAKKSLPPFFCAPDNLPLNGDNVIDILDKTIRVLTLAKKVTDDTMIDLTLLQGFEATFPCNK